MLCDLSAWCNVFYLGPGQRNKKKRQSCPGKMDRISCGKMLSLNWETRVYRRYPRGVQLKVVLWKGVESCLRVKKQSTCDKGCVLI